MKASQKKKGGGGGQDLGLLERSHGLRVEGSLRGSWKRGGDIVGEGTHESTDSSTLSSAGGGYNSRFDGQGLLG